MSQPDESKRPETTRREAASSGPVGPRRAANLRRTLSSLGVDPTCLTAGSSPSDLSNPPTLLRLPTVVVEAPPAIPPKAEPQATKTVATPLVTAAAPVTAVPVPEAPATKAPVSEVPTAEVAVVAAPQEAPAAPAPAAPAPAAPAPAAPAPAAADAPRPRPEPPTDWQNVVIQWLAAGLAAVAVMVIFTKWRDRPAAPVNTVKDTLRLQVSAPSVPDDETQLPPEPPQAPDKSVRMAGATRRDSLAAVARPAGPDPASPREESGFTPTTLLDSAAARPAEPQEVDGERSASPAPSVPDTASPDEGDDLSYDYPRTNPATYLYIDPPAASAPRFQPRGGGGMAARDAKNWETRGNQ